MPRGINIVPNEDPFGPAGEEWQFFQSTESLAARLGQLIPGEIGGFKTGLVEYDDFIRISLGQGPAKLRGFMDITTGPRGSLMVRGGAGGWLINPEVTASVSMVGTPEGDIPEVSGSIKLPEQQIIDVLGEMAGAMAAPGGRFPVAAARSAMFAALGLDRDEEAGGRPYIGADWRETMGQSEQSMRGKYQYYTGQNIPGQAISDVFPWAYARDWSYKGGSLLNMQGFSELQGGVVPPGKRIPIAGMQPQVTIEGAPTTTSPFYTARTELGAPALESVQVLPTRMLIGADFGEGGATISGAGMASQPWSHSYALESITPEELRSIELAQVGTTFQRGQGGTFFSMGDIQQTYDINQWEQMQLSGAYVSLPKSGQWRRFYEDLPEDQRQFFRLTGGVLGQEGPTPSVEMAGRVFREAAGTISNKSFTGAKYFLGEGGGKSPLVEMGIPKFTPQALQSWATGMWESGGALREELIAAGIDASQGPVQWTPELAAQMKDVVLGHARPTERSYLVNEWNIAPYKLSMAQAANKGTPLIPGIKDLQQVAPGMYGVTREMMEINLPMAFQFRGEWPYSEGSFGPEELNLMAQQDPERFSQLMERGPSSIYTQVAHAHWASLAQAQAPGNAVTFDELRGAWGPTLASLEGAQRGDQLPVGTIATALAEQFGGRPIEFGFGRYLPGARWMQQTVAEKPSGLPVGPVAGRWEQAIQMLMEGDREGAEAAFTKYSETIEEQMTTKAFQKGLGTVYAPNVFANPTASPAAPGNVVALGDKLLREGLQRMMGREATEGEWGLVQQTLAGGGPATATRFPISDRYSQFEVPVQLMTAAGYRDISGEEIGGNEMRIGQWLMYAMRGDVDADLLRVTLDQLFQVRDGELMVRQDRRPGEAGLLNFEQFAAGLIRQFEVDAPGIVAQKRMSVQQQFEQAGMSYTPAELNAAVASSLTEIPWNEYAKYVETLSGEKIWGKGGTPDLARLGELMENQLQGTSSETLREFVKTSVASKALMGLGYNLFTRSVGPRAGEAGRPETEQALAQMYQAALDKYGYQADQPMGGSQLMSRGMLRAIEMFQSYKPFGSFLQSYSAPPNIYLDPESGEPKFGSLWYGGLRGLHGLSGVWSRIAGEMTEVNPRQMAGLLAPSSFGEKEMAGLTMAITNLRGVLSDTSDDRAAVREAARTVEGAWGGSNAPLASDAPMFAEFQNYFWRSLGREIERVEADPNKMTSRMQGIVGKVQQYLGNDWTSERISERIGQAYREHEGRRIAWGKFGGSVEDMAQLLSQGGPVYAELAQQLGIERGASFEEIGRVDLPDFKAMIERVSGREVPGEARPGGGAAPITFNEEIAQLITQQLGGTPPGGKITVSPSQLASSPGVLLMNRVGAALGMPQSTEGERGGELHRIIEATLQGSDTQLVEESMQGTIDVEGLGTVTLKGKPDVVDLANQMIIDWKSGYHWNQEQMAAYLYMANQQGYTSGAEIVRGVFKHIDPASLRGKSQAEILQALEGAQTLKGADLTMTPEQAGKILQPAIKRHVAMRQAIDTLAGRPDFVQQLKTNWEAMEEGQRPTGFRGQLSWVEGQLGDYLGGLVQSGELNLSSLAGGGSGGAGGTGSTATAGVADPGDGGGGGQMGNYAAQTLVRAFAEQMGFGRSAQRELTPEFYDLLGMATEGQRLPLDADSMRAAGGHWRALEQIASGNVMGRDRTALSSNVRNLAEHLSRNYQNLSPDDRGVVDKAMSVIGDQYSTAGQPRLDLVEATKRYSERLDSISKRLDEWHQALEPALDGTKDYTEKQQKLTKLMVTELGELGRAEKLASEVAGTPESEAVLNKIRTIKESVPYQSFEAVSGSMAERAARAQWYGEGGGGGGDEGPGGFANWLRGSPIGAEGMFAGADKLVRKATSGWELIRLQRLWGMTGGVAMGAIGDAAALEQSAVQAAYNVGGGMGAPQMGEIGTGMLTFQAQSQMFRQRMGEAAFQGYGWTQQAFPGLATAAGIGLPAIGAGLVGGSLAAMAGLSATGVGLPVAALAAAVGGASYLQSTTDPRDPTAALKFYQGAQRAATSSDPWLGAEMGRDDFLQDFRTGWTRMFHPRTDETALYETGQQIATGRLAALTPGGKATSLRSWTSQLTEKGGRFEWAGDQAVLGMAGQYAKYTQISQTSDFDLNRMEQMLASGEGPDYFAQIAQRLNMPASQWQQVADWRFNQYGQQKFQNALSTYGQYSGLTQWDYEPADILQNLLSGDWGRLNQAQQNELGRIVSGDQTTISRIAGEMGNVPNLVTREADTGFTIGTTDISALIAQRADISPAMRQRIGLPISYAPARYAQAMGTPSGYQTDAAWDGMWGLQDAMTNAQTAYAQMQAGSQIAQINAQQAYLQQSWGIQDTQTALQHALTVGGTTPGGTAVVGAWGWQQQQMDMGVAQTYAKQALGSEQFMERWDLNRRMFESRVGWQRQDEQRQDEEMGIHYGRSLTRRDWTREDWGISESRGARDFGWAMDDYEEAIRFSTGRDRKRLLREQDRTTIRYNEGRGDMERQQDRQETIWKWEDEDFQRRKDAVEDQKERNEELIKLQREQMEQQKTHFVESSKMERQQYDERIKMERDRFEETKVAYEEQRELEIALRDLSREHQMEQLERQKVLAGAASAHAEEMRELQADMTKLQREQQLAMTDYETDLREAIDKVIDHWIKRLRETDQVVTSSRPGGTNTPYLPVIVRP